MRIMACYESSEIGEEVIRVAIDYAKAFDAELHVVTSLPQQIAVSLSDLSTRESVQNALLKIKLEAEKSGVVCVAALVTDDLTHEENLIIYSDEHKVDAMVIGVHKASKVGKLLFGSTAQHLILTAKCPVISVKAQ